MLKTVGLAAVSVFFLSLGAAGKADATEINRCRFIPNRANALDFPSKHAWNLFLSLMHPAKDIKVVRGEPDCTKSLGAPGTTAVWETFRLARTEVFLSDGSEPPAWEDTALYFGHPGKVPDPEPSPHVREPGAVVAIDSETNESVFKNRGGIGETRMNRATYTFIKENCLYSFDGLSRYAKAVVDGKKLPIVFPPDAMEVKAVWLEFTPKDVMENRHRRYYVAELDGKTYGLASFHILTKDVPNWFWATFHHKDAPRNEFEHTDTYGRPKDTDGTIWENYVLGGVQIDFVNSTGESDILSDARIEFGFEKTSCITCHANAKGHPEPKRGPDGKLLRDARGRIVASSEGPVQTLDVGVPKPDSFKKNGKPFFVQTDFLWSIPFRAQEEQRPPARHCQF